MNNKMSCAQRFSEKMLRPSSCDSPLKVHKIELCQNIKILPKKIFNRANIGGGTIFPRSLKTTRNEKIFEPGENYYFLFIYEPFV